MAGSFSAAAAEMGIPVRDSGGGFIITGARWLCTQDYLFSEIFHVGSAGTGPKTSYRDSTGVDR